MKNTHIITSNLTSMDPHLLPNVNLPKEAKITGESLLEIYKKMYTIRRLEITSDDLYKQKLIRGFCHLCDGQEAVAVGLEMGLNFKDPLITAYRNHGNAYMRGIPLYNIFCELLGKKDGSSKGKGGSMHFYSKKGNYYGGNGIVGAQIPVGTGLAFALKYNNLNNVAAVLYGDGAANQGQLYESSNMASIWKLPVIFVVENNNYAMGTSIERSSANGADFHRNLPAVPGIKVDGFNVLEVAEATKFAKNYAIENGPIVLNIITYRYHGHSMSDPGISYRKREEVSHVRKEKDCILRIAKKLVSNKVVSESELDEINEKIVEMVEVESKKALKSEEIPESFLTEDVYSPNFKHFVRAPLYENSIFVKKNLVE